MKIERQKYSIEEVYNWDNYIKQGHSVTESSKYFNVPYKSMLHLLNSHGLRIPTRHTPPPRKNPSMIKYFDQIDSHEKAYFQGYYMPMDIFAKVIILIKWELLCNYKINILLRNYIRN